jgi:phage terminase small subunit
MPAGRKPTPTELVRLHGSPNKGHGANKREPIPPPLIDPVRPDEAVPASLTEGQVAEWAWVMRNAPPQMLRALDRTLLMQWCVAADTARIAGVELGATGPFVNHPTRGRIIASAFRVHQMATLQLVRLSEQLGFSPTARARIFREGWEDRPAGSALVPPAADLKPGGVLTLAQYIANAPGRKTA